ncbi:hypothetical protein CHS0354_020274 [Potamilus streckersoni]|uniref:Uncharacterized protein n=1 Tax=Potamilus streckersoni TaxID=2493646 RepID=A0AAE0VQQ4_9BIVA|nr:hypothetical protein CHS0354_020274 [Potamilus streckersoni]
MKHLSDSVCCTNTLHRNIAKLMIRGQHGLLVRSLAEEDIRPGYRCVIVRAVHRIFVTLKRNHVKRTTAQQQTHIYVHFNKAAY